MVSTLDPGKTSSGLRGCDRVDLEAALGDGSFSDVPSYSGIRFRSKAPGCPSGEAENVRASQVLAEGVLGIRDRFYLAVGMGLLRHMRCLRVLF